MADETRERILILGGTGFLGSAVAAEARERGLRAVTAARGSGRAGRVPDLRVDFSQPASLNGLLRRGDRVINLVGLSPVARPRGGFAAYRALHSRGVRALLDLAERVGIARLVHVSALGVVRGTGAAYAETKANAERALQRSPLATTIVSPSLLFGPGSEIVALLDLISRFPLVPMPTITAGFRPIHVRDAARILIDTVSDDHAPPRLPLVGPELLSATDIARLYLAARGTRMLRVPRLPSELAVRLVSLLRFPGAPTDLRAMLSIDNAGPDAGDDALLRYSDWVQK